MKYKKIYLISLIILTVSIIIYFVYRNNNVDYSKENDLNISIDLDNSDQDIDWSNYKNFDLNLSESITLTEAGIYNISGNIDDGYIEIDTQGSIKLVLNNVSITNSKGPAIYVKNAENVLIYTEKDTVNYFEDGTVYTLFSDADGVIYSKDDLILDGEGILNIKANYQDGIVSKDDLKIINGTYHITSLDDGIKGKDSIYILNGNFQINSQGDGLKSTNTTDETKGYILIENGSFIIESELDGIQAETNLLIKDGNFEIITGGGSINTSTSNSWGSWGINKNSQLTNSAKGLKAYNLVIENGSFNLDTSDDGIHANNCISISTGTINILSGDDGIHADKELIIDDGSINIQKSYEGLESAKITINGGNINIVSTDDGINIAGGNDSSSMNRPGANNYSTDTNNILTINNGRIYVSASGDGIDINGSGYIYGGEIYVEGPTNSDNSALDYDREFIVNGGTLIAVGSSSMSQGISSTSTQYNIMINLTNMYSSGGEISLIDEEGNEVVSYTPNKNYSSIVISSSKIQRNLTYTLEINGDIYTSLTIQSISTVIGNNQMGNFDNHFRQR